MKSILFSLLLVGAVTTTASAQAGWGDDAWGAPKKTAKKATPAAKPAAKASNAKPAQNDAGMPAAGAEGTTAPTNAAAPADGGFSAAPMGAGGGSPAVESQGMYAAPGTPVMLQSGRNVLANQAIAMREQRRLKAERSRIVSGGARQAAAPAAEPVAPAPAAPAANGAGTAAMGMDAAAPAPAKVVAPAKTKVKAKAPVEPSGW